MVVYTNYYGESRPGCQSFRQEGTLTRNNGNRGEPDASHVRHGQQSEIVQPSSAYAYITHSIFYNYDLTGISQAVRLAERDTDPALLYPAYNLSVPIDHFHNESRYAPHSNGFFNLRYYFDASHYKPGGPVIMLAGGETGVDDRLPFLQKGIVYQLAKATNGIGVILEHRYYGTSFPVSALMW